jgi:hypothetical protein
LLLQVLDREIPLFNFPLTSLQPFNQFKQRSNGLPFPLRGPSDEASNYQAIRLDFSAIS